ncbi:MAG: phosphate/phosphite/phosphonate ABC transporter substrate-binding protein [Cyanobacteria bacterium P01_D01_bin.123]
MIARQIWKSICLSAIAGTVAIAGCSQSPQSQETIGTAGAVEQLEFGVGPYFPTPGETRGQFEPLFEQLADEIGVTAEVRVTEDWIGISEALRSGTLDVAWLGPWGYVLAQNQTPGLQAIATVKYQERPVYYSVLMARADAPFDTLAEAIALSQSGDEKLKLSLADVGSTSGWLIPTAELQEREIDPKEVFEYSEGASHAAQAIAVLSGQVDIASDYDRNLDVLDSTGRIEREDLKIIWQSDPLPNDPIVVREGLPEDIVENLQDALVNLSGPDVDELLPQNYTGFVESDGSNYAPVEAAGMRTGKLK